MASLLLGNLGSSLLGPLGGWIGSAIGSYIDNMIFAAVQGPQEGPRLDDLNVVRADPGTPIPLVFGADRIPGIVIASTALIETKNKEKVGGKGGPQQTMITYTYHVTIDYMLCEGPILGVARIWAEGNLVRGTRYEMETSTSENPENIGGIPYPAYYRDHLYSPNLIPWTLDRAYSTTDEGKTYKKTPNNTAMVQVSSAEAATILEQQLDVLYWKDTTTGYYIPLHNDHAYGVSKQVTGRPSEFLSRAVVVREHGGSGGAAGLEPKQTIIDLTGFLTAEELAQIGTMGGYMNPSTPITATENDEAFGVFVGDHIVTVQFDCYEDGVTGTVDGLEVGRWLSGGFWRYSVGEHGTTVTPPEDNTIPDGTRFIVVGTTHAMWFPVFALSVIWQPPQYMHISYTKTYDDGALNVRDWPDYWNLYDAINDWSSVAVLTFKGADNVTVYHGTMDQHPDQAMRDALIADLEDEVDPGSFAVPAYIGRAHVVFDTLQLADFGNRIPNLSFEVVQYDDVRIAAVLADMLRRAEVDEKYYDLEALPSTGQASHVLGYSVANKTSYRAAMETIMEAFRVDAAEICDQIVFRPRDREIEWVIDWNDLAAAEPDKKPEEQIELSYRDKVEMPRTFTVRFKDVERSYQVNTAQYFRQQGPSVQESMAELASVIPPAIAKAYARDKMRDVWLERCSIKIKVPHKYVYVYPTDFVRINGGDYGHHDIVFKVGSVTRGANGILEIEGVIRANTVYQPRAGEVTNTAMDNSTWNHRPKPSTFTAQPAYTVAEFLDLAPLQESDWNAPYGFYMAMGGGPNWKGAGLYASRDSGASYKLIATSTTPAVMGRSTMALADHRAEFVDFTNYVDIELLNLSDTLETINDTQLLAGFNYCVLGDEVLQFRDVEKLVGYPNRWRLSTLVRGRRGTDRPEILAGHAAGERFVILQQDAVFRVETDLTFANTPQYFKIVPIGLSLADVEPVTFTNTGNLKKAFAPVFVRGVRDSANNLSVQWIRQDKVGWQWVDGQDTYLTETYWDHVIEFLDPTGTTVKRTFNCLLGTEPYRRGKLEFYDVQLGAVITDFNNVVDGDHFVGDYLYTAAMQTADGYTPGDPVWVRVYKTYSGGYGHPTTARV